MLTEMLVQFLTHVGAQQMLIKLVSDSAMCPRSLDL